MNKERKDLLKRIKADMRKKGISNIYHPEFGKIDLKLEEKAKEKKDGEPDKQKKQESRDKAGQ